MLPVGAFVTAAAGCSQSSTTSIIPAIIRTAARNPAAFPVSVACPPDALNAGGVPNDPLIRALPICLLAYTLLPVLVTVDPPPVVCLPYIVTEQPDNASSNAAKPMDMTDRDMASV